MKKDQMDYMINKIEETNSKTSKLEKYIDKITKDKISEKTNWDKIMKDVNSKHVDICAICMCDSYGKKNYVLSCSHVFHKNCLESFERFDPYYTKKCPICRSDYDKKEIMLKN